jgi:hypothetical protein
VDSQVERTKGDSVVLLFFQLLFLFVLLVVNGEPLRAVLLRRLRLFSDLDFVQVCILNVYLGGLVLYVFAVLPFGLFSWEVVGGFTVLSAVLTIIVHFKTIAHYASIPRIKAFLAENRKALLTYLAVFLMLAVFLVINLSSLSGLVFGSVRDESIHSLDVQVILENHFIPLTLQPYLPEGIIYPQAAHVIFAFSSYVVSLDIPQVVFYVTVLFKSLSVLGAYFLGRKLGANVAYSLGLSFVIAFMSSWPLYVVWGANPFLVGFPLFLVCLGLLFSFFRSTEKHGVAELVTFGLLIGYAGAIIISFLQTLIVLVVLVFICFVFLKRAGILHVLREYAIVLGVSLLPMSPFVYRFVAFYPYPGHNIGLAYDFGGWTGQQLYANQALQWALDNLSPYLLLKVITLILLFSLSLLLWKTKLDGKIKPVVAFALVVFASATLLSFVSFFLSADLGIISWGHQGLILSVPITILIFASYVKLNEFLRYRTKNSWKVAFKSHTITLTVAIIVLSLLTAPFLYHRFLTDTNELRGSYNIFAVTTLSDYELMNWMKTNLSPDAVILVHPYGSGLFIPSISNHKVIFPYTGSSLSSSYQMLVGLMENGTLNLDAYQIMHDWNITHIFIGTNVAYWMFNYPKWDAKLFLGNPNFRLVKSIGSSYLFEPIGNDSDVSFVDNFASDPWHQNGWRNETLGQGLESVAIEANCGVNGSSCLSLTAQAVPPWPPTTANNRLNFTNLVEREVFVPSTQGVTLSFYLNVSEGFHGMDTFALVVYNLTRSDALVITTPNGVYLNYTAAATFDSSQGLFNFNLSEMWQREFNASLPQGFVLQFANSDFDGVTNVAYIDDVTVTSHAAFGS